MYPLPVSLAFSSFVCGRHLTVIILSRMSYVLLFWTSLKVMGRARERKREAIPTACRTDHQKSRITQGYLAVVRLLLPTSNLLRPSTVCIWRCEQDWKPGSQITSRPTTDELLTVTAMEDTGDIPLFVVYI